MNKAAEKKPNIVFVVPAIAHEGISKQVLLQTNALIGRGYSVKLIVLTKADRAIVDSFVAGLAPESIVELRQPHAFLSVWSLLYSFSAAIKVNRLIREWEPEVALAHAPYAHFVMRLARLSNFRKTPYPKLWQYFHITQYAEYPLNSWKRKLLNKIDKWLASRYDYGHIFVSEAVKRDVQANFTNLKNSMVFYNALPQPVSQTAPQSLSRELINHTKTDIFTILLPGRVEPSKGQVWFLESLREFIEIEKLKPDQLQVIVAGGGSQLDELKHVVVKKELQSFVRVVGNVANAALLECMRQSKLVVVPSFVEGLPLVILEALQQRAVVLASDIEANREVISSHEVGILFKTGDVADCVAKLRFVYRHRESPLLDFDKIEAHIDAKFSFEKHIQKVIALIENA